MDHQLVKRRALQRKRQRIRKKISGTAERPRLSVYRSEQHIYAQLIDDRMGVTIIAASTQTRAGREVVAGLAPTDAARRVGELLAEAATAKGIERVVFDRGGRRYAGRIAALAEGARSKGLQF